MLDRSHSRLQGVVESDGEGVPLLTDDLRGNREVWQHELDGFAGSAGRNTEDARAGNGDVSELHELRAVARLYRNQFARREPFSRAMARPLDANKAEHHEDNQIVPGPGERRARVMDLVRSPVHVEGPNDRGERQDEEDHERTHDRPFDEATIAIATFCRHLDFLPLRPREA